MRVLANPVIIYVSINAGSLVTIKNHQPAQRSAEAIFAG